MTHLELRGLSRQHPGSSQSALTNLDLDLDPGELLCLVGPSGCGKSTTLRLIAGLDVPSSGQVLLAGRDLGGVPPQDRDVAMVFQGYALYPHLSVADNLAFPLRMRRVPRADRERRVRETASLLGLERLLGRLPGELSGGERQRVAMGRALVRQPKLFLFDEPLANLDAALRNELRVELGQLLRKLGTASLYVTHDQVEAMTLGDRIAVLRAGRLEQVGAPQTIYESPANLFVAGFLGSPPMNLLELEFHEGELVAKTPQGSLTFPQPPGQLLPREGVIVGLRPEHLQLVRSEQPRTPSPGERLLEAPLKGTEPLGSETLVHLDLGSSSWVLRAPGIFRESPGAMLRAVYDPKRLQYFRKDRGTRLEVSP